MMQVEINNIYNNRRRKSRRRFKILYKGTATGSIETGYTITNTFTVPDEKVSVKVTKEWEDTTEQEDKRPTSITIVLSGNGKTEEKTITSKDNWDVHLMS